MLPSDIPAVVLSNPWLVGGLTVVILALVAWQRTLTYSEYRLAHKTKTVLFVALDGWARRHGRPLINRKGGHDDAEFLTTHDGTPARTFQRLRQHGFDPHLVATLKRRDKPHGRQYAHSQLVYFHTDGTQTEAILFPTEEGGTDVYVHHETAAVDPEGHLTDPQADGDVRDETKIALGMDVS